MLKLNHKNLEVWREGVGLVQLMYGLTEHYPKSELYGLVSQIRRAAVSVPSNLAEGAARDSGRERARFYEVARSSLVEIDTQLEISQQLGYLSNVPKDLLVLVEQKMNKVFAMLCRLIQKTTESEKTK